MVTGDTSDSYAASIIVATRNESLMLPETVPSLLEAAKNINARVVWVCNACTDNSASIIRDLTGNHDSVLETETPGKTQAFNLGDEIMGDCFPRFYVDADAVFEHETLQRLIEPLLSGEADLVAPRQVFDLKGASPSSIRIAECWMTLPHATETAFSVAIGLSREGRSQWGAFPKILGDDVFIAAQIASHRRKLVLAAAVHVPTPRNLMAWVRTRRRWINGEKQILAMGLEVPRPRKQREALIKRMFDKLTRRSAVEFLLLKVIAQFRLSKSKEFSWEPQRRLSD